MVFKLMKKKDSFGVYNFLSDVNKLLKFVNKKQSKNNNISVDDVTKIIVDIKELFNRAKEIELSIKNARGTEDKQKQFYLNIMVDKFSEIKTLYEKVLVYEKKLGEYSKF